ncbi:MAG TPA: hypothetical protein DCG69_08145 [Bacteroidales bacterium]|nr:hypothetical protein [Bacteroidales bacterium]
MGASEYVNNQQGELELNCYYNFLLVKIITMPDGIDYFIIKDPFGKRHLMEAEPYKSYDFKIGESVEIRIDKINCKGKVFFEPKHPRYGLGSTVKVEFLGHTSELDKFNEERQMLLVKDPDGNETSIRTVNEAQRSTEFTTDFIYCEVCKISKGRLELRQIG